MSGPYAFARQVAAVDQLLQAQPTWEGLGKAMFPGTPPDAYNPQDDVKKFLAASFRTVQGRAFLEWVADLTVRAAPGHSGETLEAAAIAHAKHEARWAVGQAIFRAAAEGDELLNRKEPAP
jgi:hypothetical protein